MATESITEFMRGKTIFLTGGTGFMGKVLIEKILRSCPDVDVIYVLTRKKKGLTPEERWQAYWKLPLFDLLRSTAPEALQKVVPVAGDLKEPYLGLSHYYREVLTNSVHIIFNVAANVNFMDDAHSVLHANVLGTLEIANLAKNMKQLKCFLHTSTTYCNTDRKDGRFEKVYPSSLDLQHMIHFIKNNDTYAVNCLFNKMKEGQPNAYTLGKLLGENIMLEFSQHYPVVIFRPSVVVHVMKEPLPGWIDLLVGPFSLISLVASGMMKVVRTDYKANLEYIAVDYAINGLLAATWEKATREEKQGIQVYNCSFGKTLKMSSREIDDFGLPMVYENPMENMIWAPWAIVNKNPIVFNILFFFLQVIPSVIIDVMAQIVGKKPRFKAIAIKMARFSLVFDDFIDKQYLFDNTNYKQLMGKVPLQDKETFYMDTSELTLMEFMITGYVGVKKFIFKESEDNLLQRQRRLQKFLIADRTLTVLFFIGVAYLVVNVVNRILNTISNLI